MTAIGHPLVVISIQNSRLVAKYLGKLKKNFDKTLAERLPDLKLTWKEAPQVKRERDFGANLLSSANALLYKDI